MINFVILTNKKYFLKFKLCYESIKRFKNNFHIFVFCEDNDYKWICKQGLTDVTITPFSMIEHRLPKLLEQKANKTPTEYAWTIKPNAVRFVQNEVPACDHVFLIGADMYFFNNPMMLLRCVPKGYSVGRSPHKFSAHYDYTFTAGIYNTDFVYFKNDKFGRACAAWWGEQCINYCYKLEREPHKRLCGDQTYANWFTTFLPPKTVWDIWHYGVNAADYNIDQFDVIHGGYGQLYMRKFDAPEIDVAYGESTYLDYPLICYQFHAFKSELMPDGGVLLKQEGYPTIPDSARDLIYKPYLLHLEELKKQYPDLTY